MAKADGIAIAMHRWVEHALTLGPLLNKAAQWGATRQPPRRHQIPFTIAAIPRRHPPIANRPADC
jgi:hypothetical protein